MNTKMNKDSDELDREIEAFFLEKKPHKPHFAARKNLTYLGLSLILSLVVFLQSMSLASHETGPQFSLTLKEGNNETTAIMSTIRLSLQVITFLAEDFSFGNYSGVNDIDSFDSGSTYELFYNSYHKITNHSDYSVSFHGLDAIGCLVKDFGVQLGKISHSEDPKKLEDSFSMTYSHTIKNFDEMYYEAKKTGEYPKHFDEQKLKMGHSAYSIQNFGTWISHFPFTASICSLISCGSLLMLCIFAIFKPIHSLTILIVGIFQIPLLTVHFCAWASELRFYYKLCKVLKKTNLAVLQAESGYLELQMKMLMVIITQVLIFYTFYQYRQNKH